MMNRKLITMLAILFSLNAVADETGINAESEMESSLESEPELQAEPETDDSRMLQLSAIHLFAGTYESNEEAQLVGIRNDLVLGMSASSRFTRYPFLGIDTEVFYISREFDTPVSSPPYITFDNDTKAETYAMLFGGRITLPANGIVRVYGSGGLGLFSTSITVTDETITYLNITDDDFELNMYYGAGVQLWFKTWTLSVDYRHFEIDGDFGDLQLQSADLGGDVLTLGIGAVF
jgi:hypothetical protein